MAQLSENQNLMTDFKVKDVDHSVNSSSSHPLADFSILIMGIMGVILVLFATAYLLSDTFVRFITINDEARLAKEWNLSNNKQKHLSDTFSVLTTENNRLNIEKLINELWQPFNIEHDVKLNLSLTDMKRENAWIGLGGNVTVTSELVNNSTSENDLAFVLCHELGHFKNRDVVRGLGNQVFFIFAGMFVGLSGAELSVFNLGINSTLLKFSRDQETRADEFALDCMSKRYGHIEGFDGFFSRVGVKRKKLTKDSTIMYEYFSTHPQSDHRIQNLKNLALEKNLSLNGQLTPLNL